MTNPMEERQLIRELIENWVLWRDAGDWERFRTVWHNDGAMMATWFQGSAADFIEKSREGRDRGVEIFHFLGGMSIDVSGTRATVQTKMTITQRGELQGVLVDVVCTGRFFDFVEKRDGRWGITLRQPIYEFDRLDPVYPGTSVKLDMDLLKSFPAGYCHLAYLQHESGFTVKKDMPILQGEALEALYARGREWLSEARH